MNISDKHRGLMNGLCLCGSGHEYARCCGLYHTGERTPTSAEQLMRSRYSAYALGLADYVCSSWHSSTRPVLGSLDLADSPDWISLSVLNRWEGESVDEAFVEFCARFRDGDSLRTMSECSRFIRENGCWFYVDGKPSQEAAEHQNISRNASCSCGSGKKYKRCCGK